MGATVHTARGRTSISFTYLADPGTTLDEINEFWRLARAMWAIGTIGGNGSCTSPVGFHGDARSSALITFPFGRWECDDETHSAAAVDTTYAMLATDMVVSV